MRILFLVQKWVVKTSRELPLYQVHHKKSFLLNQMKKVLDATACQKNYFAILCGYNVTIL